MRSSRLPGHLKVTLTLRSNQELRAELCALKLSALRKRAAAAGVDEDAMEAAADGSDEKGDLVDSICSSRARLGRD